MRPAIIKDARNRERPLWQKLAWFVGLWAASVATIAAVGFVLRLWIA
ncbi:DUF2474 domain-containing protein [Parasphingopyxis lamellibrachiae]|nr:DUF2474 domain-containing protein [Parasphingopyxis lamellibrachiae]